MANKRKANNKVGSNRPTKQMRMNSSSDSEEEEIPIACSSCVHYRFLEQEEQNFARTARSRRRKDNRHVLRNRTVSATPRRGRTRERERRNTMKYERSRSRSRPRTRSRSRLRTRSRRRLRSRSQSRPRTRSRCKPKRQEQDAAKSRRLRSASATPRHRGSRGRERQSPVEFMRSRTRCTPMQENHESRQSSRLLANRNMRRGKNSKRKALRKRGASATRRQGSTRGRERRNTVKYERNRPRNTPRRQNQEPAKNRRLRGGKKSNRQASRKRSVPASPHRHRGNRGQEHRDMVQCNQTGTRRTPRPQNRTRRTQNSNGHHFDNNSCLARRKTRARGRIPRHELATRSSSSSLCFPTFECTEIKDPGHFSFIYYGQETDLMQHNVSITGENFSNQIIKDSLNSKANMNSSRENENQDSFPEAPTEQPASSGQVSQNTTENVEAIPDNSNLSIQSMNQTLTESEEIVYRIILLQQAEVIDGAGMDVLAGGDGVHNMDDGAIELEYDNNMMALIEELEAAENSNPDILNSQPSSVEEHLQNDDGEHSE